MNQIGCDMNDAQTWCFKSSADGGWRIGKSTKDIHTIHDLISTLTRSHNSVCSLLSIEPFIEFSVISDTELMEITKSMVTYWMYRNSA